MTYEKTINEKTYTIEIGIGVTKVSYPHDNGLICVYEFKALVCEEQNKRLNPHFIKYFLSPSSGEKLEVKEVQWVTSEVDFDHFDATLGQIIRHSFVNGLFFYLMGLEKPFDPENGYQLTE